MRRPDDEFSGASLEELTLSEIELTRALQKEPQLHSSPTATAPAVGTPTSGSVGRYELLLEIAAGGMATVYIGRQRGAGGFERLVAIKRMHRHVGVVPELAAAFMDEARIASLINHPNVVNVHDVHDAEGEHLLVMDYVDGPSLANVMRAARKRNERISRPAVIRILIDALSGLHAAHELTNLDGVPLGVVHRDATPHNILLGTDGSIRITDFGIAKAAERSVHTATGLAKGKFRYMAPEQAKGGAIDRRVDVFAMGIVAFELLTGERMFQGESDAEVLLEIANGHFRNPASVDSSIPAELDAIVDTALAPTANERWPSAKAFAEALEGWARMNSELVSSAEIARLVNEFCGAVIVERRKNLALVLQGVRPPAGFATVRQTQSGTGSSAGTSAPITMDSVKIVRALTPEQIARHRLRRQVTVASAAALGTLALALLVVLGFVIVRRSAQNSTVADRSPPSEQQPVADPELKSGRVRVAVTADTDVTEVRGPGVANVEFKEKSAELTLPRSDQAVAVIVRLADGSEITESIVPSDNTSLRVRSIKEVVKPSELPVQKPTKSLGRPSGAQPARPAGGGLEKNPYE